MTKRQEMKKRFVAMLLIVCMVLTMMPTMAFAAGTDITDPSVTKLTSGETYEISDVAGLTKLSSFTTQGTSADGCTFELTRDIDASAPADAFAGIDGTNHFKGTFDGKGYTITLALNTSSGSTGGLFGAIGTGGTVKLLTVAGSVTGTDSAGGIAAVSDGTITQCKNTATITSGSEVGGIVGANKANATLSECVNTGRISGSTQVGGLAGFSKGTVANCYNTGSVSADGSDVGGIVGSFPGGSIACCYNIADVTGGSNVGGIVGGESDSPTSLANCISLGCIVSGTSQVNRIVGQSGKAAVSGNYARDDLLVIPAASQPDGETISAGRTTPQSSVFHASTWKDTQIWTAPTGSILDPLPTLAWENKAGQGPKLTIVVQSRTSNSRVYTLSFDSNGGDTEADPKMMWLQDSTALTLPTPPKKDGFKFQGWATTKDATEANFTADTPVLTATTVYAVWKKASWEYFAFANSTPDFFNSAPYRYFMNYDDWATMQQNIDRLYKGNPPKNIQGLKDHLWNFMVTQEWGGSCYGIATSEGLLNTEQLAMENFSPGETTLPTVPTPASDSEVRSNINFHHVTQMLSFFRNPQYWGCLRLPDPEKPADTNIYPFDRIEWKAHLQGLIDTVKQGPTLFCYYFPGYTKDSKGDLKLVLFGHAVILDGIKSDNGKTVIINARDNRYPGKNGTGIVELKADLTGTGKLILTPPPGYGAQEDIVCIEYTRDFSKFARYMPLGKAANTPVDNAFGSNQSNPLGSLLLVGTPSGNTVSTDGTPPTPPKNTDGIQTGIDGGNTNATMIIGTTTDGDAAPAKMLYETDGQHDVQIATAPGQAVQAMYSTQNGTSSISGTAGTDSGATTIQTNGTVTGDNLNGGFTASVQSGNQLISVNGTTTGQPFMLAPGANGDALLTGEGGSYTITMTKMHTDQKTAQTVTIPAGGGTVMLQENGKNDAGITTLSLALLDQLIASKTAHFAIKSYPLTLNFDLKALKHLRNQSGGEIRIQVTKQAVEKLSPEAQTALGNHPAFDISISTLKNGQRTTIADLGSGHMCVTMPYAKTADEQASNILGVYVNDAGVASTLANSNYDEKLQALSFGTNHCSVYGIGYKEAPSFSDTANHWAKDDIAFVAVRGLLSGTAVDIFSPDLAMTRGMFVTALGRLAGADVSSYTQSSFSDVQADAYYMGAVEWAAKNGIVSGLGDKLFAPDQAITREQMAAIMVNYAKAMGYAVPQVRTAVTFGDEASIGSWATDSVETMQRAGILGGKAGNTFDPTGTATRAEVAAVLHRYMASVLR